MRQGLGYGVAAGGDLVEVDAVAGGFMRYEAAAGRGDRAGEDLVDRWFELRGLLDPEGVAGDVHGQGGGLGDRADIGRSVRGEPYAAQLAQRGDLAGRGQPAQRGDPQPGEVD